MAFFRYVAVDSSGASIEGGMTASSSQEVYLALSKEGLIPISIKTDFFRSIFPARIGDKHLALVCQYLADCMDSGLSEAESMEITEKATQPPVSDMLRQARYLVTKGGRRLGIALEEVGFPFFMTSQVDAGWKAGTTVKVLRDLASWYEWKRAVRWGVIKALFYPGALLIVSLIAFVGVLVKLVPRIEPLLRCLKHIPVFTRFLLASSHFLVGHPYRIVGGTVLLLVGLYGVRKEVWGIIKDTVIDVEPDSFMARLPAARIFMTINILAYLKAASMSIAAGRSMADSLKTASSVLSSEKLQARAYKALGAFNSGEKVASALSLFVPYLHIRSLISVGERTGRLPNYLERAARQLEMEVDRMLGPLATVLEFAVFFTVAIFVAFMVVSILLPMYAGLVASF